MDHGSRAVDLDDETAWSAARASLDKFVCEKGDEFAGNEDLFRLSLPIPTKAPVCNGMMPPLDSGIMPPPVTE
jgi:hypothetical protein